MDETIKSLKYFCLPREDYHLGSIKMHPVQLDEIEKIRNWRNAQIDVLRQLREITPQEQVEYFDSFVFPEYNKKFPNQVLLTIWKENEIIGYGGLVHINWEMQLAEISFLLDPSTANIRDLYSEVFGCFLKIIFEIAFEDLYLRKIYTETFLNREFHIQELERAGMQKVPKEEDFFFLDSNPQESIFHVKERKDTLS